ncbi:venom peptide SjAPI-2-like isoform X2 [Argiope bruennichi]|uniref:venom peptide SjAPI-2-like isoform X2 n=1 Tax=Argiope bruennichi TaxID=94029 RepID=UPI0024955587|nr:venom peptide SjAPI-2-like isoform X2 [Argiope bruennichi]
MKTFFVFCFVAVVLFQTISACDDNQYPNECGTACPVNCQNRHSPPSFCTQQCVNRCDCKKGYIFKSGKSGQCVKPRDCP